MAVTLTDPQKRMLDFVRCHQGYRPQFYAEKMWGGKSHQNARNASVLLWRLENKSLVEYHQGHWYPVEQE